MDKQILIIGIAMIIILVGFSECIGPEVTEYFNQELEADENTILKVTSINGKIEIIKYEDETVTVDAIKKTHLSRDKLDEIEINITENNNYIDIVVNYLGTETGDLKADMNIKIPDFITVESATTTNGAIQLTNTKGDTYAQSVDGNIKIDGANGYVKASTINGRIDILDTTGVGDLSTISGIIYAEIFDFQEDIEISSINGRISIYINPNLNADLDITTSNGDITITGISINTTTLEDRHVVGTLGEGGNEIYIHTTNGNIFIYKLDT